VDLTLQDGVLASSQPEAEALRYAGYVKCSTPNCNFFISPQSEQAVLQHNGYYTCPKCQRSYDLQQDLPWHGAPEESGNFATGQGGGGTRIGLNMTDQAQIGEDLIRNQGELPGYGPIIWWHEGSASANSPLDGATRDWGIEVKTLGYDAMHHRFIPGREQEKVAKNDQAAEMGLKGILGVLVLLDYRRSVADVYVKEMSLQTWLNNQGKPQQGVAAFRKNTATRLLEELPFKNPFMDPSHPSPQSSQEHGSPPIQPEQQEPVPF